MPESKSGALTSLATPLRYCPAFEQGMLHEPLRDESLHRCGQRVDHALRRLAGVEARENAAPRARHACFAMPPQPLEMLADRRIAGADDGFQVVVEPQCLAKQPKFDGWRRKVFHF